MIDRTENAQRALVWLLLIGVAGSGGYTMVRLYAPAFQLAQLSRDDALIASLFVVGAVMAALMLPKTLSALFALMGLSLSIAAGIAGAAALPLGLIEHAPLFWRGLLLGSVAAPFACTPLLFWNMKAPLSRGATSSDTPVLTVNQPNQLNQPTQPNDQPTVQPNLPLWLEDNQPDDDLLQIDIEEPPPGIEDEGRALSEEVRRSVLFYAREGSYKEAAARLGKNPETIRKNVLKARDVAPNWYKSIVKE